MTVGRKPGTKKTGGKDFAPGNPGGPGRPPLPPGLRDAKRLTKTSLEEIVNKYLWEPDAAELAAKDPRTPPVEKWLIAIIAKGLATGEWSGFEWIAQRLVGKVKEQIEVKNVTPFVIRHTSGEQTVLGAKAESEDNKDA